MPYIAVTTSKALSDEQKDELKKTIGQKISLIPGKTEAALMVDIFRQPHHVLCRREAQAGVR